MPLHALKTLGAQTLDWFLPPLCPATGEPVDAHGMVTSEYWASLRFIRAPFCPQCAMPFSVDIEAEGMICAGCIEQTPSYRHARAAMVYDDASRTLILRYKHGDQLQAVRTLVPWMLTAGTELLEQADVIMPVPLHRWRLLHRRYNQSALLARALGKAALKPVMLDGLLRIKSTPPQGHHNRKEREANVKGAFKVNPTVSVQGKTIVLIDDVMTTGATLNACAQSLLDAGAFAVDVLCVARAVRD